MLDNLELDDPHAEAARLDSVIGALSRDCEIVVRQSLVCATKLNFCRDDFEMEWFPRGTSRDSAMMQDRVRPDKDKQSHEKRPIDLCCFPSIVRLTSCGKDIGSRRVLVKARVHF